MQNYKYLVFSFLAIVCCLGFSFSNVFAVQEKIVLKYPISELENCQDKNACKQYCDVFSHYLACTDFGEKNNLITKEEAVRSKKLVDILQSAGPGGCKGEVACKNYCNKIENQKECFNFSMKNGLISAEKLKEIENSITQVRSELKQLPPEMKSCIIEKGGAEAINKIESGKGEAIDLVEIGGVMQNCATTFMDTLQQKAGGGLEQAPPEAQDCVKLLMDKIKSEELTSQSDITSVILQNCLPAGTKIPSPKDLESLKKAQEQYKNMIPQGMEIPGDSSGMGM